MPGGDASRRRGAGQHERAGPTTLPLVSLFAPAFAGVAPLFHLLAFVLETLVFRQPKVHRLFRVGAADVPAVRIWAFNQGFYNLFLALGAFAGLVVVWTGSDPAGRALVVFACASMVAAALVLIATNARMARAAAVQGVAPLVALVFAFL